MGTRCGTIDPSTVQQVEAALNHESGLLGVSGISGDMCTVLDTARTGHASAHLALAVYSYRVRQAIGALTVTMGGVDALVLTAGVGKHAAPVRETLRAARSRRAALLPSSAPTPGHFVTIHSASQRPRGECLSWLNGWSLDDQSLSRPTPTGGLPVQISNSLFANRQGGAPPLPCQIDIGKVASRAGTNVFI
jgi:acetokinase family protein